MSNERQKKVTDEYRENWERIFGKKKEDKDDDDCKKDLDTD